MYINSIEKTEQIQEVLVLKEKIVMADIYSEKIQNDIDRVLSILQTYPLNKVILYGSIARGDFREDSDLDICVQGLRNKQRADIKISTLSKNTHAPSAGGV